MILEEGLNWVAHDSIHSFLFLRVGLEILLSERKNIL